MPVSINICKWNLINVFIMNHLLFSRCNLNGMLTFHSTLTTIFSMFIFKIMTFLLPVEFFKKLLSSYLFHRKYNFKTSIRAICNFSFYFVYKKFWKEIKYLTVMRMQYSSHLYLPTHHQLITFSKIELLEPLYSCEKLRGNMFPIFHSLGFFLASYLCFAVNSAT